MVSIRRNLAIFKSRKKSTTVFQIKPCLWKLTTDLPSFVILPRLMVDSYYNLLFDREYGMHAQHPWILDLKADSRLVHMSSDTSPSQGIYRSCYSRDLRCEVLLSRKGSLPFSLIWPCHRARELTSATFKSNVMVIFKSYIAPWASRSHVRNFPRTSGYNVSTQIPSLPVSHWCMIKRTNSIRQTHRQCVKINRELPRSGLRCIPNGSMTRKWGFPGQCDHQQTHTYL